MDGYRYNHDQLAKVFPIHGYANSVHWEAAYCQDAGGKDNEGQQEVESPGV